MATARRPWDAVGTPGGVEQVDSSATTPRVTDHTNGLRHVRDLPSLPIIDRSRMT